MFDDPDYDLQWPAEIFLAEAASLHREDKFDARFLRPLLNEAFTGSAAADRLDQLPTQDNSYGGLQTTYTQRHLMIDLMEAAAKGDLRQRQIVPRWRSRQQRAGNVSDLDQAQLRQRFCDLVISFDDAGYFDAVAPHPCVDDNDNGDPWDFSLDNEIHKQFGHAVNLGFLHRNNSGWDPVSMASLQQDDEKTIGDMTDDEFYDLIEIFHDLCARPRVVSEHDFANCGNHYSQFHMGAGQRLYRWRINQLLDRSSSPVRMADDGELQGRLILATDESRTDLLTAVTENATEEHDTIDHAIALFRGRGATTVEKRSAVVALAGVLEEHRKLLKQELLTKDEQALFTIANNYGIRHQREAERTDYDPVFLDWVFWWYLATIELIQRLTDRKPDDE